MKKLISLILTLCMTLSLAACGGSDSSKKVMLKILDTEYITENYAAAFGKDKVELLDKFNAALAELKADGTVDKIIGKYIKAE